MTAFIAPDWKGLEDRFLISIDHHVSGRPFAHVNWIDPHAVATAEMVFRLAREAGVKFSSDVATCLYTALMADTGSFMFQGTNENTFALARELVLAGADPAHCARGIYFAHSIGKIRLLGEALRNLIVEGHIGYAWVTQKQMERCAATEEDCEGLVNYVLSIGGVEVAAFFASYPRDDIASACAAKANSMLPTWPRLSAVAVTNAPADARSMARWPKRYVRCCRRFAVDPRCNKSDC